MGPFKVQLIAGSWLPFGVCLRNENEWRKFRLKLELQINSQDYYVLQTLALSFAANVILEIDPMRFLNGKQEINCEKGNNSITIIYQAPALSYFLSLLFFLTLFISQIY